MKSAGTVELLCDSVRWIEEVPRVALLVYASMPGYFDVLFAGTNGTLLELSTWIQRPGSVFSHERVRVVRQEAIVVGVTVELPHHELTQRQRNDSSWLLQHSNAAQRRNLATNAELLRAVAPPPCDGAYYLRCLAVDENRRGLGLGHQLMSACVSNAIKGGFNSLHLDVRADNAAALALYRHHGFAQVAETIVPAAKWHTIHMVREGLSGEI